MGLLRTLFIIAIIYFTIRFIARNILPFLVKNAVDKAQRNMMDKMAEMEKQQSKSKEGEISINYKSKSGTRNNKDGEYVDYEEVK